MSIPFDSEKSEKIKRFYEGLYEQDLIEQYAAYLRDEELYLEEELLSQYEVNPADKLSTLHQSVIAAYEHHREARSSNWVRLYAVPFEKEITYSIRATNDGDDGWLEIYGENGGFIGAARTYLEVMGWLDQDSLRATLLDRSFPQSLEDRRRQTLWQFGSMVIHRGAPERFVVNVEKVPPAVRKDVVALVSCSIGVRPKAVELILDYLPHSVTSNLSVEAAEEIFDQLVNLDVVASICESTSKGWVTFKSSKTT